MLWNYECRDKSAKGNCKYMKPSAAPSLTVVMPVYNCEDTVKPLRCQTTVDQD